MKKTFLLALALLLVYPFSSSWAKKPTRITVLCYNIQTGKRASMEEYAAFIKKYNPDLVAFQELDYMTKRLADKPDFVGDLAKMTGMYSAYEALMPFSNGQYGIGIMSKYPFEKVNAFTLPEFKDSYERRGALNVVVTVSKGVKMSFTSTHLDLPTQEIREAQVLALSSWLAKEDIPAILCGDFNALPTDKAIIAAMKTWNKMCNDEATFPNASPKKKIDYFLAKGKGTWRTVSYQRIAECPLSDHCPIVITLEYTE